MTRLYVLYTGGTFGMVSGGDTLSPKPIQDVFRFLPDWNIDWFKSDDDDFISDVGKLILPLSCMEVTLGSSISPVDSSSINTEHWRYFAEAIHRRYHDYDGFVIIHGTDTMAYTASALSFMLSGLGKAVVLTGAMKPIDHDDSDARLNLDNALLIAALPAMAEVVISFGSCVIRGCRAVKSSSIRYDAFSSPSFPELATLNPLDVNTNVTPAPESSIFKLECLRSGVDVCWLHPGIDIKALSDRLLSLQSKAMVLACYGVGHITDNILLIRAIRSACDRGMVVVAVSQCLHHPNKAGRYSISHAANRAGVIDGGDATFEATITKLMWSLANCTSSDDIARVMNENLRGERTV